MLDALSTHLAMLKTLLTYLQGQHAYVLSTLHRVRVSLAAQGQAQARVSLGLGLV